MTGSEKIAVRKSPYGKGVYAVRRIGKGELVAAFDGRIYGWHSKLWNNDLYNHCIQFAERKWRDSRGVARLMNHSCRPNCGIRDLFSIVAMRDIRPGEQVTWDYEMTEDHPYWRMRCKCGVRGCRGLIGSFQNMPDRVRKKYRGYISDWLIQKYHLS